MIQENSKIMAFDCILDGGNPTCSLADELHQRDAHKTFQHQAISRDILR